MRTFKDIKRIKKLREKLDELPKLKFVRGETVFAVELMTPGSLWPAKEKNKRIFWLHRKNWHFIVKEIKLEKNVMALETTLATLALKQKKS